MKDEIYQLVRIALAMGRIERGINHPDGKPETDADHLVSTTWLACSLAARFYPQLDLGLVAQFAVVHDAVEAYAGDLYAVTATSADRAAQKLREYAAWCQIRDELPGLGWLPQMIDRYEQQEDPEARFVWAVDKMLPKILLRLEGRPAEVLREHGVDTEMVRAYRKRERELFEERIPDFPEIMQLREELHTELTLGDEGVV